MPLCALISVWLLSGKANASSVLGDLSKPSSTFIELVMSVCVCRVCMTLFSYHVSCVCCTAMRVPSTWLYSAQQRSARLESKL